MNLVYVVKRFPKVSETFVLNEVRELIRQGDGVRVFSLQRPHPGDPRHPGAEEILERTVYLPEGAERFLRLATSSLAVLAIRPLRAWPALWWTLRWAIRQRRAEHVRRFGEAAFLVRRAPPNVDQIHAHFAHGAATVALLAARLTRRPFSFTGHAKDIFQLVPADLLAAKVAAARFAVAVSGFTRDHMRRALPAAQRRKVVVVRNGVDRSRLALGERRPDQVPLIVAVSRLVEKKGIDTLVRACAVLASEDDGLPFRSEVIGDGPRRERLEGLAARLGISDRVLLVGARAQGEVTAAYRRAAVFALPCRRTARGDQDGLPVALVEAMAAGVPVVTTAVSGIPEVVRHEETGLLVPPDDPDALAAAIRRILTDAELGRRLAKAGVEAAAAFDLERCVAELRSLFRDGPDGDQEAEGAREGRGALESPTGLDGRFRGEREASVEAGL